MEIQEKPGSRSDFPVSILSGGFNSDILTFYSPFSQKEARRRECAPMYKNKSEQAIKSLLRHGGVGGIRTLGRLLTVTRFPIVLVMATSIPLHIADMQLSPPKGSQQHGLLYQLLAACQAFFQPRRSAFPGAAEQPGSGQAPAENRAEEQSRGHLESERTHAAAPPFQIASACAGLRFEKTGNEK